MRKEDWLVLLCIVRRRTFVMLALTIQCLLNANGALKKNQGDRNLQTEILNWKEEIRQFLQVIRMCPWIKISRSSIN